MRSVSVDGIWEVRELEEKLQLLIFCVEEILDRELEEKLYLLIFCVEAISLFVFTVVVDLAIWMSEWLLCSTEAIQLEEEFVFSICVYIFSKLLLLMIFELFLVFEEADKFLLFVVAAVDIAFILFVFALDAMPA